MSEKPDESEDQEVLDESQGSILMGIISQLRKGSDLSKVTLPTFVLEPRSMLERITDFMSHPELILDTPKKTSEVDRFVDVVRFFLSGWHIRPQGVKKPYNPVLGELFRCEWTYANGTKAFYLAEQVTHHPPSSAYIYASPENGVLIQGEIHPKSKFLGNSAATIMEGGSRLTLLSHPNEVYEITNPNVYARGILFGTMFMELGDSAVVKCEETDLICELEFKVKGFFTGTYNGVSGKIKRQSTGETLYTLSGKWTDIMYISKAGSKQQEVLFDVSEHSICAKTVKPESEQEEFESRRLWSKASSGLKARNMDLATKEKTAIEDNQRKLRAERTKKNEEWQPRFFTLNDDKWELNIEIPKEPKKAMEVLYEDIFAGPKTEQHAKFWLSDS